MNTVGTAKTWSDPVRVEHLKDLWNNTDYSASKIGHMLGVTRNAVIGKSHRLGLRKKDSPIKRQRICALPSCKNIVTGIGGHKDRAYCSAYCSKTAYFTGKN